MFSNSSFNFYRRNKTMSIEEGRRIRTRGVIEGDLEPPIVLDFGDADGQDTVHAIQELVVLWENDMLV